MPERQVRVSVIMDDSSYVAGGASVVSTNTKIATSQEDLAAISKKTADAQVAAILKVREASKLRISQLQTNLAGASGFEQQSAATVALQREQAKLARTYGETAVAGRGFSTATKTAEVDANKLARGVLAGSGALNALGRSLAFASSGFIAFAVGATIIKASIKAAQDEAVAQRQVAAQLKTSGKAWKDYGSQIDSALLKESHLAGFTKADLLQAFGYLVRIGGNVQKSLTLTGLAADVARARTISLQSASIALAKALGGSATALRRLGIIVPKNVSTTQALAYVTAKFAGQAKAGTTASERFHATLVDTGAVIGKALLPTFNRLATSLGNWLAKMNESGKLTKDLHTGISTLGDVFHGLEDAVKGVDEVTGGFKRTLELLIGLQFAKIAATWVTELRALAVAWGLVGTAATEAGAAQGAALATSGVGAAARGAATAEGAAAGGLLSGGLAGRLASRARFGPSSAAVRNVSMYTTEAEASGVAAGAAASKFSKLSSNLGLVGIAAAIAIPKLQQIGRGESSFIGRHVGGTARSIFDNAEGFFTGGTIGKNPVADALTSLFGGGGKALPVKVVNQPSLDQHNLLSQRASGALGTAGTGPPTIFKSFSDTIRNQLAQARAALTKSTADDVAAAKGEIALIRREIAAGHLQGTSLIQALQAQASAVSTIQSAEAAAAQKRAAALAKLKAKIAAQIANSIDPLKLELQLSKDQADNAKKQKILHDLKALRNAARAALASGDLSLQQQKQAYDQITQLNSQIQALNKKQAAAAKSQYHQLNLTKLTSGLGLTPAQRRALRASLSQVGHGNTVPDGGTGAYGYRIGHDDRPIHIHTRVDVDGRKVAQNTTKHQQRRRRRNSSQRRGPNAGDRD